MTRFRADFSDSSDEDEYQDDNELQGNHGKDESESEDSSRSPSPDIMDEQELTHGRKQPHRNALIEDEDGEIRYAHEVVVSHAGPNLRVSPVSPSSSSSSSSSSPPTSRIRGDPTIIPWAQQLGVDAQKMHVMQTSLFRMPEEAAALKALNQPTKPSLRVPFQTLNRKHSRDSDGDGLRKTSANSSTITKTIVPIYSNVSQGSSLAAKLLQHHLSNSPITPDEDGIPFATPNSAALHFSSFASLFPSADRSYEASLFRLGQALFDEVDLRLGGSITVDIRNRITSVRRKAALSAWLENVVEPTLEAELRANTAADAPSVAFTLLTGHQTEKAVTVAMDGGYLKLASLIAQAGGDWEFREDLKDQLQLWKDQRIDAHIDESVRKVYALLAGIVEGAVEGSRGGGLEKAADIDVLKGLDWKRAFGAHLWFSEPVDAPIAQVFQAYDQLVKRTTANERHVARPLPWYAEKTSDAPALWNLPSTSNVADGLFSLIRLHAEPACSLSQILTPLSFGTSPVDYSLAWHLYIILSRCMRVRDFADRGDPLGRVRRMDDSFAEDEEDDEDKQEGHSPSADLLASGYAFQLEGLGMIQEALFVLLHIEGSAGREKAIKDLLARSAAKLDEWMTRGIVGSLKIPLPWVLEAKALNALDKGEIYEAYELFLEAGLYNAAHDLAVLELAPDAIIRHDLELLKNLFVKFIGRQVDAWHVRGKVFLDYVQVMTRLPELVEAHAEDAVSDAVHDTEIDDLTKSVPRLIGLLPDVLRDTSDPRHSAALSEMVSGMVAQVNKLRPLVLSQVQPALMN
ncbi:hypothetical protein H0H81_001566, partial [Sphagnurus paluster]